MQVAIGPIGLSYDVSEADNGLNERIAIGCGLEVGAGFKGTAIKIGESSGKDITFSGGLALGPGAEINLIISEGGVEFNIEALLGLKAGGSVTAGTSKNATDFSGTTLGYIYNKGSETMMSIMPSQAKSELNYNREEAYACWAPVNNKSADALNEESSGGSGNPSSSGGGGLSANPMDPVYRNVTGGW